MSGETNLSTLLSSLNPILNKGEYVFINLTEPNPMALAHCICFFKEAEGSTYILNRSKADEFQFSYDFVAAWITLKVHSSLEAVGLTAVFSSELAKNHIGCNAVAGYYHDHIFVAIEDGNKAIEILQKIPKTTKS
ncbi:ACT domain-containing protein [Euzebyella saccharophila]|uniref:ACT domain-containing protein n=1 Tax=Euzebyella saccharophila TaxID=679664 RepID=A0ABV8JP92_9FLAO|nr:ACT domain-containing protein [Euzebyella saccharophila]